MKFFLTLALSAPLGFVLTGMAAAQPGNAPSFETARAPFSGQIVVVRKNPGAAPGWQEFGAVNIGGRLEQVWKAKHGTAEALLREELGQAKRWNGQTAYDLSVSLADRGQLYARVFPPEIIYVLPGNSARFHMTSPTIFGKPFDPKFHIDFDLELVINLDLGRSPQVGSARAVVTNARLRGANVSGTVGLAVTDLVKFLGNDTLRQKLQERINGRGADLSDQIGRDLGQLAGSLPPLTPNMYLHPIYDRSRNRLLIEIYESNQIIK